MVSFTFSTRNLLVWEKSEIENINQKWLLYLYTARREGMAPPGGRKGIREYLIAQRLEVGSVALGDIYPTVSHYYVGAWRWG